MAGNTKWVIVLVAHDDADLEPQVIKEADVHCVTGWSLLAGLWKGVQIATLAEKAGMKGEARFVILEAAHGFTSNVPLKEATAAASEDTWIPGAIAPPRYAPSAETISNVVAVPKSMTIAGVP